MVQVDVVGLGQCSLDFLGRVPSYPEVDTKAELGEFLIQGGGPVATAMVALSRLGVKASFLGRVGGDDFGRRIGEELAAEGIDCTGLRTDPEGSSQVAFIAVEGESGRRTIFWNRGSARPLTSEEVSDLFPSCCRILHLDGLQHEASLSAARLARERGVITVLDGGTFRAGTTDLLPFIDHLVVSEKFALRASGEEDPARASKMLLGYGAHAVTVTLGGHGSYTLTRDGEAFHQPAFRVQAVDTTGCGDVFHGGYIFGLLQNWGLRRSVRFAAACAALKTRALGGRTAIPRLEEVERFFNDYSHSS